jgi:hypothetical protein
MVLMIFRLQSPFIVPLHLLSTHMGNGTYSIQGCIKPAEESVNESLLSELSFTTRGWLCDGPLLCHNELALQARKPTLIY